MPADLTARLAFASVVAIPLALIFHARRRSAAASQAAAHRNAEKAAAVKAAAARASAAPARKKKAPQPDDSSESEEEQVDEREQELWKRVEEVLKDYSLSPLMIAASRKWVRQMSDPNNEQLARLRQWMLHRINGRLAAPIKPPLSEWQRGCPEILAGLRAQPFWDRGVFDWLRPFEEHFNEIRAELLGPPAPRPPPRTDRATPVGAPPLSEACSRCGVPCRGSAALAARLPAAQDPELGVEEGGGLARRRRLRLARPGQLECPPPAPRRRTAGWGGHGRGAGELEMGLRSSWARRRPRRGREYDPPGLLARRGRSSTSSCTRWPSQTTARAAP